MNPVIIMKEVKGDAVTERDLLGAMLVATGCSVGNMPSDAEGDNAITSDWEWFDPFKLRSVDDVLDLPAHWRTLVLALNRECWSCGYRYIHAPEAILGEYPRVPRAGIFGVMRSDATPYDVTGKDLIHLGGQCVESDIENKGIIRDMLDMYCSGEES